MDFGNVLCKYTQITSSKKLLFMLGILTYINKKNTIKLFAYCKIYRHILYVVQFIIHIQNSTVKQGPGNFITGSDHLNYVDYRTTGLCRTLL